MNENLKFEIALTKLACIICTEKINGPTLMNKRLTKSPAKKVKELHEKIIDFTNKPCKNCQEMIDKAFIFVGFDEDKSDMNNFPEGLYRTGHIIGVKKDIPLVQEWVKEKNPDAINNGFLFLPHILMHKFGLIKTLDYEKFN